MVDGQQFSLLRLYKSKILLIGFLFCNNFVFGQEINVLKLGAKGDFVQDDTKYIQKALDFAEDQGGGIVRIPTAKKAYKISETLFIGSNTTIIFENTFFKLSSYTKIGTILLNKKGATNIEIINPLIDGNNISSGGTGENGISFGNGGTCLVKGGIIKNCKSGKSHDKLGGKGFQVEDKNVELFKADGTFIINCTFALSSQFNIIENKSLNSKINVIYDNIKSENCESFALIQQVNGLIESASDHNVVISNFKVNNCGYKDGVFIFSRARGVKISEGVINGRLAAEAIIRGRHSETFFDKLIINQNARSIIDLRPSFHGIASSKSENNNYILSIIGNYGYLIFSSLNDDYPFRELFDSKLDIQSNKSYDKNIILPQAIYKTSKLDFKQINNEKKIISRKEGSLLELYKQ